MSETIKSRIVDPEVEPWEQTYSTIMHLALLGNLVAPGLIVIAPLIMWLIKKEESPFVDDHGREALNFQISLVLMWLIVVPLLTIVTCGIGALGFIVITVVSFIGMIQGSMAASRGEYYRYPMCIRLIK